VTEQYVAEHHLNTCGSWIQNCLAMQLIGEVGYKLLGPKDRFLQRSRRAKYGLRPSGTNAHLLITVTQVRSWPV